MWSPSPPPRAGVEYNFRKDAQLRYVQQELCGLFRRRFPATKASIRTSKATYDSFADQPFLSCEDGERVEVIFSETDDPFFYDLADRRAPKITIEQEIEWDMQIAANQTTLSLEDWIRDRRGVPPPPADEWELPPFRYPELSCPPDFSELFKKASE